MCTHVCVQEASSAGTAEDGGNTQHEGGSETTRTPSPATPFAWTNDRRGGPLPPVLTPADGEFQLPPQSTTGSRKKRNRGQWMRNGWLHGWMDVWMCVCGCRWS